MITSIAAVAGMDKPLHDIVADRLSKKHLQNHSVFNNFVNSITFYADEKHLF